MRLLSHTGSVLLVLLLAFLLVAAKPSLADGDLRNLKHIIVIMQENHSFDNCFGALPYAPGTPYHSPGRESKDECGSCPRNDHACVDGLTCQVDAGGNFTCENSNRDNDGSRVAAFHDSRRCVGPDLDHEWANTHREMNFNHPNETLFESLSDGFVRVNDKSEQLDKWRREPDRRPDHGVLPHRDRPEFGPALY